MTAAEKIALLNAGLAFFILFCFWIIAAHFFRKVEKLLIEIKTEGGLVTYALSEKAKVEAAIAYIAGKDKQ